MKNTWFDGVAMSEPLETFLGQLFAIIANFEQTSGHRLIDVIQSGEVSMTSQMQLACNAMCELKRTDGPAKR